MSGPIKPPITPEMQDLPIAPGQGAIVTPTFAAQPVVAQSQPGLWTRMYNMAASTTGAVIGAFAQLPMDLFVPSTDHYKASIDEKSQIPGYSDMLHRLACGLFEFISEKMPGNFFKSLVSVGTAKGSRLLEALLLHAINHVNKERESPYLVKEMVESIFESVSNFIEKPHPRFADNYERYKTGRTEKDKREAYDFLCNELNPLVNDLTRRFGLDEKGIQPFISTGSSFIVSRLRAFLIDQILDFYGKTVLGAELSTDERVLLRTMKTGHEDLELASKVIAEQAMPWLKSMLAEKSTLMASKIDKVVSSGNLTVQDEAILSKELYEVFVEPGPQTEKMFKTCEGLLSRFLNRGLVRLAIASPLKEGDAKLRLEAYFRDILSKQKFDPLLAEKIKEFRERHKDLANAEKTLEGLRNEALSKELPLSQAFSVRYDKARDHVDSLREKINTHAQEEICAAFRPLIKKVLADMRYTEAKDLPVPEMMQEAVWNEALMSVVPDLLMDQYAKLQPSFDVIFSDVQKRPEYVRNLAARGHVDLPSYARSYARYAKKFIDSFCPLNAANWLQIASAKIGEMGSLGPIGKAALKDLFEKRGEEIADWAEMRGLELFEAMDKRAGLIIEDGLEAFIVRMFDSIISNVSKVEERDPTTFFRFMLQLIGGLNKHLELINRITREQGKKYMYEVDPLVWLREFERARMLDPAMPGFQLQSEIHNAEQNIQALEHKIKEKSIELSFANQTLNDEKEKLKNLKQQAERVLKEGFFDNFAIYLFSLCNIKSAEDLPLPKEYQEKIWDLLTKQCGGDIMLEAMRSIAEPEKLNKMLATALEMVNESLVMPQGPNQPDQPLPSKEDEALVFEFVKLLEHAKETIPGSLIGNLAKIDELRKLPGPAIAQIMRDTMKGYSLEKMLVYGIKKGSEVVSDMLLDPLPKTRQELAEHVERKKEDNIRNIEKFHREAGAAPSSLWENLVGRVVSKWNNFQASLDLKVERYTGWIGRSIKKVADSVCHLIFIDLIVRPLYWTLCLPVWVFNFFYAKRVVYHAEHVRRSIIETSIHQNFGIWAMRQFKGSFTLPR